MEQTSEVEPAPASEPGVDDAHVDALLRAVAYAPRMLREPKLGDVIDERYQIEELLGRGGMGLVFAVRDLRTGKALALKWMTPTALRGTEGELHSALARFEREARIASRIAHPNLVDVYDVCVEDESAYLVMERLRGETLRARIRRARLDWDEALAMLLPAMRGVAALHRAGVVHRDLKPDNIFLCVDSGAFAATTKVLDLGISHESSGDLDGLTKTGSILGTPAYMPLEQLRGGRDIGPATDVYALGVVLYEALAGERPFEARTAADQAVLLATERPTLLHARVPSITESRASVVMKALARDPADRFGSTDALIDALLAADHVAPAPAIAPLVDEPKSQSRLRRLAAPAALVVLAVGVAAYLATSIVGRDPNATESALAASASAPTVVAAAAVPPRAANGPDAQAIPSPALASARPSVPAALPDRVTASRSPTRRAGPGASRNAGSTTAPPSARPSASSSAPPASPSPPAADSTAAPVDPARSLRRIDF